MAISAVLAILFLFAGILLLSGKGSSLSAALMLPKANADQTATYQFLGKLLLICTSCAVLWAVGSHFSAEWLFSAGLALFFAATGFGLIYWVAENRFEV